MDSLKNINIPQSLSYCDLNTNFNDKSDVDWSKSNLISIVSANGIYILKPQLDNLYRPLDLIKDGLLNHKEALLNNKNKPLNNKDGPFEIELIRNPAVKFKHQPVCDRWPTFDTMWHVLRVDQYMEVYLDPALMTNIDKLSLDLYPRRFRLARWSPVIEAFPKQCLLAAITIDYQLLIYKRSKYNTWVVQNDLSKEYDKLWSQFHKRDDNVQELNFDAIQNDLHSLSFCHICWKETRQGDQILLATTISGDIVVWQVIPQETNSDVSGSGAGDALNEPMSARLEVKIILKTNLDYISSMHMFHNLLIVSARDGQVVLFDLTIYLDKMETFNLSAPSNQPLANGSAMLTESVNLITLPITATIWHGDNIEVADFYLQSISQDTFRIVLAKSTKICWCTINYTQRTEDGTATLAISDTFSAIDGLDPDSTLFQTPATSLKPAGDRKAVLIADDGSFFQLEFLDNREDSSPEINAIITGRVDLSRMVPRGLCTSPQGNSIAMISYISLIYDSSKILAPAKVILLPVKNDRAYFIDCFQKLFDENWLETEGVRSTMDVCDRIDHLRSILPTLSSSNTYDFHKALEKVIKGVTPPENEVKIVKLKIAAFLLMKLRTSSSSKSSDGRQRDELEDKVHHIILMYEIRKILSSVSTDFKEKKFNLYQYRSLRNFYNWLQLTPEGKQVAESFNEMYDYLKTSYFSSLSEELCSICLNVIPLESAFHGTCTNGHRFNRCARTLLLLDLQLLNEVVCEHCERCFLPNLLWSTTNLWLCSFCQ